MRFIIKRLGILCMLFGLALLGGCNGGGSGSAVSTLTGTAASGAPLDGYVYAVDALGAEVNVAIGTGGTFSLDVTGMTGPFLLRAVPGVGTVQYSWASAAGQTVNITPLTSLALFLAINQDDLAALYTAWPSSNGRLGVTNIQAAQAIINANFAGLLNGAGLDPTRYDFLRTAFSANGADIDGVLDDLAITIADNGGWGFTVQVGGSVFGFDAQIDVTGYDIGSGAGGGSGGASGSLPSGVAGQVVTMEFCCAAAGAPYSNGEQVLFTFSSSGMLMLTDQYTVVSDTFTVNGSGEYVWTDAGSSISYALSLLNGAIHEVNVYNGNTFLGQFAPVAASGGAGGGSAGGGGSTPAPSFDAGLCTLQPNGAYLCPPNAIGSFGPYTVVSTGSSVTCTVDFDGTGTAHFQGGGKSATLTIANWAVSVYGGGGPANIAATSGRINVHVGSGGEIDNVTYVDVDFSSVICFDTSKQ